ncbi:saccharopine dehydrogenase NADP-binding domain-containing protein [Streptomyces lunaelactis]|uniref:saccharopine dehydrogenase family protein n=1 Tax=Streptomyces lunaelactis TaxID=1535768 RepID=UPI0015844EE7|nr:saccharopine dehydrogenase NADP-binding domain-containing protein [Streptomyces lunaelactis]NUK38022.1 saccharopine dehydrogenase NADP-binding domain-containing protein [Streptomyces lunaelactis]NUK60999.1 saccharopine dehydrogenase NADP-binding domain-containing protein [Streptomyces lunaelactis]NUK72555.1 saccharopine dehydrogenase NADP-binding domain-containing protein [Streptomyces lunaelactis]NUK77594.1 saccharopine dehydrogenase NADP-binding domain-containing protein [Streptomyces luna
MNTRNGTDRTERPYDIVLFGATGFVGALTAEYLAAHAPDGCRWAVAGRSREKLELLRERLAAINPDCAELPLIQADADDPGTLRELAESTRVVATTVGPYVWYGEPLVAACAEAGTDYADLTGEPEFVDLMYVRHDARARETGARIVHACGYDSVPHDLGTYFTVQHLPKDVPLNVDAFVRSNATFSGGTFASALTAMSRGRQTLRAAHERRLHEPRLMGRRARAPLGSPRFSRETGAWALPLPTLDPQIVARSAAALPRYGPDFRYREYAAVKSLPMALGGTAAVGAGFALAQLPAARRWLMDRVKQGEGPSPERRARSWFSVRFVGEGGGRRVFTEVSGGDPGYDETAKMLGESALCLALDPLPKTSGQVTTAVAMGDALLERLRAAGISFRVADSR